MDQKTIDKMEDEARKTGGIPRRQSIARTLEQKRKRKSSAPPILNSPEKPELLTKPEEEQYQKKFKKQQELAQEREAIALTVDKSKVDKEEERSQTWIKTIKEAKDKIIKATTRYSSGKLSFNKKEQSQARENIDVIMDLMVKMSYEIGKGQRKGNDEKNEKILNEQKRELQELLKITLETRKEIKKLSIGQTANNQQQEQAQKETTRQDRTRPTRENKTRQPPTDTDRQTEDDTDKEWAEAKQRRRPKTKV